MRKWLKVAVTLFVRVVGYPVFVLIFTAQYLLNRDDFYHHGGWDFLRFREWLLEGLFDER